MLAGGNAPFTLVAVYFTQAGHEPSPGAYLYLGGPTLRAWICNRTLAAGQVQPCQQLSDCKSRPVSFMCTF